MPFEYLQSYRVSNVMFVIVFVGMASMDDVGGTVNDVFVKCMFNQNNNLIVCMSPVSFLVYVCMFCTRRSLIDGNIIVSHYYLTVI